MSAPSNATVTDTREKPIGNLAGFTKYFPYDILSGFLVFLIALPLCLGIALACGYPAIAGIFTAIIGALITTFISNSELTIKGPAAGLIVIVMGCVESFGGEGFTGGASDANMAAYRLALGVGVAAAVLQILFGLVRAGIIGEIFPLSAVHGMLAAIGVIIIAKQIPVALGVQGKGEPLQMLRQIPNYVRDMNPEIALIGIVGLTIMFVWPWLQKKSRALKAFPSPLIVLAVTVPIGMYFDLLNPHLYSFHGQEIEIGPKYLVNMPDKMFGMFDYLTQPDFSGLRTFNGWKWVFMFFAIGTLESMLSAKAVDLLDPWRRKTNLDRDMLAVGTANLCSAMLGGLPMISEIVRSKANIDNGARTRFADMWHGIFLLLCVALIPTILHRIPLAALAAMLIYTGFRLTHPKEFMHVYAIGKEQLLIFVSTLVGVLVTADLLLGIMIGIGVKLAIHLFNGVPIWSLFKPYLDVDLVGDDRVYIRARQSAIFSNWISFRKKLVQYGLAEHRNVTLDLSQAEFVDHSVMEKLRTLQGDFDDAGLQLELRGLGQLQQLSQHDLAARKRGTARLRRVTVVAEQSLGQQLADKFVELGASGFTAIPCSGAGRRQLTAGGRAANSQLRVETVVPREVADRILDYLRTDVADAHLTACVEHVEVLQRDRF